VLILIFAGRFEMLGAQSAEVLAGAINKAAEESGELLRD
jgi:predicted DsbA family dithiol-disulfide isomerase